MTDLDAYRSANILLQQHGRPWFKDCCDKSALLAAQDQAGADAWRRTEVTIHIVLKQALDPGEARH